MKPHDESASSAAEWLRCARVDLRAAEALRGLPEQETTVCFHAQQAAEKALKAYLAWLGADDIPKTHDLERLSELIVERGGMQAAPDALDELDDYGIMPRYPGSRPLSLADATAAIVAARSVVGFVQEAVEPAPPESR